MKGYLQLNLVSMITLFRQQTSHMRAGWKTLVFPPVLTLTLYFLLFGHILRDRIGPVEGQPFSSFIAPGLLMLGVLAKAFSGSCASFGLAKISGQINDLLVSPTANITILIGYVGSGVMRGVAVALFVIPIFHFLGEIRILHPWIFLVSVLLVAVLFSMFGLLNAILTRDPSQADWLPMFILTPLTYLGGVFFSVEMLSEPWRTIAAWNPLLYAVNLVRYGMTGYAEVSPIISGIVMIPLVGFLSTINLLLLKRGYGLRV